MSKVIFLVKKVIFLAKKSYPNAFLYLVVPLKVILIESKKFSFLPKSILKAIINSESEKSNIIKNS